jgi:formylglycine-generating enzyme required for sulfatase activity
MGYGSSMVCLGRRAVVPFPYGSTYSATACNVSENGVGETLPVSSKASCRGGYLRRLDLTGNVWEWADSCSGNDECRLHGCSLSDGASCLACGNGLAVIACEFGVGAVGRG